LRLLSSPEPRLAGLPCSVCTGTPHADGSIAECKGMVVFWAPPWELPEGSPLLHHLHVHPTEPCVALHTAVVFAWHHTTAVAKILHSFPSIAETHQPMHHSSAACNSKTLALHELQSALGHGSIAMSYTEDASGISSHLLMPLGHLTLQAIASCSVGITELNSM